MQLPNQQTVEQIAALFKGFDDPTRVKILSLLTDGERCVGEIVKAANLSLSVVSHQLRLLKGIGLVKFRRDGKTLRYSLANDQVLCILKTGLDYVTAYE